MFGDIVNKLKLAQEDSKSKLEHILVDGQADNGSVKVVVNANKVVKQILISQELFDEGDKEAIEELVQVATNKALEKAEAIYNEEMKGMAKDVMPNIPGLNF
jgi:DNA-binding YbaB/EbfC family protein